MALFCAAIRRDSVSLLKFLILCYDQVFLCEITLACRLKYPYSFSMYLLRSYCCPDDIWVAYAISGRYYHYYPYFTRFRVFPTSVIWWFSTGVWVTASHLKSLRSLVVWMIVTRPLISISFSPYTNPLVTVLSVLVTTGITVTFMFHSFFDFIARSRYLSLFSLSFNFPLWSARSAKYTIRQVLFFCWLSPSLIVWPRLDDPFVSQNPREFCVSFSRTDSGLCINHFFIWSNSNFLHNS